MRVVRRHRHGRGGRIGIGRLTGIQHQRGHAGLGQQAAQRRSTYKLPITFQNLVFEFQIAVLAPDAMPIEMHQVVRLARGLRLPQHVRQPLECGRTQHGEPHGVTAAQAFQHAAGDRAERHIPASARTADRQQHADRPSGAWQQLGPRDGVVRSPHKGARPQRQRHIRLRIAQQFPRQRGGILYGGLDLYARAAQLVSGVVPDLGVSERLGEQIRTDLRHAPLDARGDGWRWFHRILQEIFQVPANVFLVLRGEL